MWRVALRSLTAHKRRLIGTCSAVVLGVAFLAGTLVLSDTIRASFDSIFTAANAGTDAVVQGSTSIGSRQSGQLSLVPDSLLPELRSLPEVASAEPTIQGIGQIAGSDGKPIGGEGPPTLAGSWMGSSSVNPYKVTEGVAPTKSGEIVINKGAATTGKLKVGDKTTLSTPKKIAVIIVGLVSFGNSDGLGGTTYAGLTFADAQKYLGYPGKANAIVLQSKPDVSQDQLVAAVKPLLPTGVEAVTGTQLTADQNEQINSGFLGFFKTFLLVFAAIALVVASFSIYNTFAVIVAQRTRESALLRALGATRAQIMRSLTLESLIIGVIASAIGIGGGILLATGLKALLDATGSGLPPGGLVITGGTVLLSMCVGVTVTVLASVLPAIRASRIPPLAALRDVAVDNSNTSAVRKWLGSSVLAFGLVILASMAIPSDELVLARAAVGAGLTFIGFLIFAPIAAKPVSRVLGVPIKWVRGVSGSMATRNAGRNPKRTANTAAALMVGVMVVTLFTIFAASIKSSIDASVAGSFKGQLVMSSNNFSGSGYSPEMIAEIDELPQVAAAAGLAQGTVLAAGQQLRVTVTNAAKLGQVLELPGRGEQLSELSNTQFAVSRDEAAANGWDVGSAVLVAFADGATEVLKIGTVYDDEGIVGNSVFPVAVYAKHVRQVAENTILIGLAPGAAEADGQAAVQGVADKFSAGPVQTREQFIESASAQIDQLLNVVYVLLFLAIVIALMGITNTLSMSIYERTRELGLLRAVGQTRGQTRSMVRWESVIIALFGTLGGLVIGVILGWALMKAVQAEEPIAEFALPISQLVVVAAVGAVVGVLAGIRPSYRAAKLDVLTAIGAE